MQQVISCAIRTDLREDDVPESVGSHHLVVQDISLQSGNTVVRGHEPGDYDVILR